MSGPAPTPAPDPGPATPGTGPGAGRRSETLRLAGLVLGAVALIVALGLAMFGRSPLPGGLVPASAVSQTSAAVGQALPAAAPGGLSSAPDTRPPAGQAPKPHTSTPPAGQATKPGTANPPVLAEPAGAAMAPNPSAAPILPPAEVLVRFAPGHPLHRAHMLRSQGEAQSARALIDSQLPLRPELRGLCFVRFTSGGYEMVLAVCPAPDSAAARAAAVDRAVRRLDRTANVEYVEENLVFGVQ